MTGKGIRSTGTALASLGLVGMLLVYWLSFFWVSTDRLQGVSQRIFYIHVFCGTISGGVCHFFMIEKIPSGLHFTGITSVFHHDAAFGVGTIHGLISILLEWDTFASADSSVGRNQHFSAAINNTVF